MHVVSTFGGQVGIPLVLIANVLGANSRPVFQYLPIHREMGDRRRKFLTGE
jgi:hypothetical protein